MKEYVSFPTLKNSGQLFLSAWLCFGTGICRESLFSSFWKSIWHSHWQVSTKLFHSSSAALELAANRPWDVFLTWGTCSLGTLCKHSPGLLPALQQVVWMREPWVFTNPTASSHSRVEDGPSSYVIRHERVVLGLVYAALWSRGRKREREARGGEGRCICHIL